MSSKVETDHKIYNTENLERLAREVKEWKEKKMLDPFCLCPFYDPTNNKKYND